MRKPPPGCARCASRSRTRVCYGRNGAAAGSIEPRSRWSIRWPARAPALWAARDQLASLMMGDAPGALLAYEQIAGDQSATAELLFADDERGIAVEENPLVIADDAGRVGVRQDAAPTVHDRLPVGERGPAWMDAGDRRGLCP